MGDKMVIIFDFDRTLIEDDSDRWVLTNMGLTQLFNQLRTALPWNTLMDRMLEELYIQGKTVDDVAECLKGVPLHPQVVAVIRSAHSLGCDLKVASDSNLFYIKTILEHHGIYNCFSEIITNPVVVEGGRLRIFPYHDPTSPHGCDLCPPNMCKGRVINRIQASTPEIGSRTLLYVGDGMNDFCPTLKLVAGDSVMPRKNFPLWTQILNNSGLVKHKFSNGLTVMNLLGSFSNLFTATPIRTIESDRDDKPASTNELLAAPQFLSRNLHFDNEGDVESRMAKTPVLHLYL